MFEEGFQVVNQVERAEWTKAVEAAKDKAENEQGVQFLYPDTAPFQEICIPMHQSVLGQYPDLKPFYEAIQVHNQTFSSEGGTGQ